MVLVVLNVVFAGAAAGILKHWRDARAAATDLDPNGIVAVRLRRRPWNDDEVERWVLRALGGTDLVPTGGGTWADRRGAAARVTPPVVGDRATLVEVSAARADAVVGGLVGVLLDEGWDLRDRKGRRVSMRRGPERLELLVDRG